MSHKSAYRKATIDDLNESLREVGRMKPRTQMKIGAGFGNDHAEAKKNLLKELGSTRLLGKGDYDIRINTRD